MGLCIQSNLCRRRLQRYGEVLTSMKASREVSGSESTRISWILVCVNQGGKILTTY